MNYTQQAKIIADLYPGTHAAGQRSNQLWLTENCCLTRTMGLGEDKQKPFNHLLGAFGLLYIEFFGMVRLSCFV
jgi:hypothetical protein